VRRLLVVLAGVAVAIGALVALVLFLGARDDSQLSAAPSGPGELQEDRGASHDGPAEETAEPPTSGTHQPDLVTRDRRELSADQLIHALELGNVVILYEQAEPPPALVRLQEEVAGPFDAELAAAGQAVILARDGTGPATALAWRRVLRADDPADPAVREFAETWLGVGLEP
jgi:Protein of unknown function (DUF3105)